MAPPPHKLLYFCGKILEIIAHFFYFNHLTYMYYTILGLLKIGMKESTQLQVFQDMVLPL